MMKTSKMLCLVQKRTKNSRINQMDSVIHYRGTISTLQCPLSIYHFIIRCNRIKTNRKLKKHTKIQCLNCMCKLWSIENQIKQYFIPLKIKHFSLKTFLSSHPRERKEFSKSLIQQYKLCLFLQQASGGPCMNTVAQTEDVQHQQRLYSVNRGCIASTDAIQH